MQVDFSSNFEINLKFEMNGVFIQNFWGGGGGVNVHMVNIVMLIMYLAPSTLIAKVL